MTNAPIAAQLESDLSVSSGVARWLCWFDALEKAQPPDFPRLARIAAKNETLTRLIARRWAELYPHDGFDYLVAASRNGEGAATGELAWGFLREWAKRDPRAAIEALENIKNVGRRDAWRSDVADAVFEIDPELGLTQMFHWHINDMGPNLSGVEKWAAADPRHAAEFTVQNPAGYAAREVIDAVGKQWAKTDPAAALDFAASQKSELGSILANTVLLQWASRDLAGAGNWLSQADPNMQNRLAPQLTEAWGKQDSATALAWAEANLSGSALARAVGGLAKGLADADLSAAATLVQNLEPSAARAEAALAVAQKWMPRPLDDDRSKTVPPELTAWLRTLDSASLHRVLQDTTFSWSDSDPASLADFLVTASPEAIPWNTYFQAARLLAERTPALALEWTERLPDEQRLGVGAVAFSQWYRSQPEPAMTWFNALPADDPRRQPFLENAIRRMAWDSQAEDKIKHFDLADQATMRRIIQNMDLREDRRTQLLSALPKR